MTDPFKVGCSKFFFNTLRQVPVSNRIATVNEDLWVASIETWTQYIVLEKKDGTSSRPLWSCRLKMPSPVGVSNQMFVIDIVSSYSSQYVLKSIWNCCVKGWVDESLCILYGTISWNGQWDTKNFTWLLTLVSSSCEWQCRYDLATRLLKVAFWHRGGGTCLNSLSFDATSMLISNLAVIIRSINSFRITAELLPLQGSCLRQCAYALRSIEGK